MRTFFNYDNGVWKVMGKLGDIMLLNLIFIIFCIPIVTIGASKSALYAVAGRIARNEEGYIFKDFWTKFKENFKYSTFVWLIYVFVVLFAVLDLYACEFLEPGIYVTFCRTFMVFTLLLSNAVFLYCINLVSVFENTFKNTLINGLIMSVGHFPYTIMIVFVEATPIIAFLFLTPYLDIILTMLMVAWFAIMAFFNSFLFDHIFKKYVERAKEEENTSEE